MEKGSKIGIVCCSNGQTRAYKEKLNKLENVLLQMGLVPVWGDHIYEKEGVFSGTGKERAESLMEFYRTEEIKGIFDISGGDIANEVLPYLDFDVIAKNRKRFWGYSDLTTVINGIYAKTGAASVLYQLRNLIRNETGKQITDFSNTLFHGTGDLFSFRYEFIRKERMQGIVVGGNIRCLLKLAGTPYWPDMEGKIVFLEGYLGKVPQMVTYLNQLQQIGVFSQAAGILLGTFTEMEQEGCVPAMTELVCRYAGTDLPIAKTDEIGHGADSKGIVIGKEICLSR